MTQTVLDQIGGEEALRTLVEHFYDLVETVPEGRRINSLHLQHHGMAHTRVEQFNFLSGFMGGRQYYLEKHRHMNVKEIHAHIPIQTCDAENWLAIMDKALDDLGHNGPHIDRLRQTLRRVALMLVNDGAVTHL
ncbi:group II truncated hemoglobin [Sulfitobacter sp. M57]|uniref:group II truncated hemoglobin n=1 Tax=unclassified Sulfitobacter TaxID=196795 RepID=UPI0023E2BADC|nr:MULTISPECIES: group II truncated hemoglobin [unclassified Sulfitobacter]MDF3416455.1 group II truncated hemoglobin [Sulfitobacter sp. KE5]MDF3423990.1 group II truncated hemoglobin [Sulfitobacter sp. KE43]MDF3435091.1 group II truncated hemoglobin [Sulfitobacter sp. KE42]MDF3460705.1 group II truncated hemoglobin [Sulfitobacter sp. S74]MDF3464544.1 group II truncated hemoglobin [Sulfitobacter sp. Ks18]